MAECQKCGKPGQVHGASSGWRVGVWCPDHLPPEKPLWLYLLKTLLLYGAIIAGAVWLIRRIAG